MANAHVKKAIAVYVDQRLHGIRRFKDWPRRAFLGELTRILAGKAGGIPRTVVCHLAMIKSLGLTEEARIIECINPMPGIIFKAYERMLVTLIPRLRRYDQRR